MKCRHCLRPLDDERDVFIDLGLAPPSNAFLRPADLGRGEPHFPLKVMTCPECWLVQIDEVQRHDELFSNDYAYFSSFSRTWLDHARGYVDHVTRRLGLGTSSMVMEVASNDGYLLQFMRDRAIPCVGIEPTACTADAARAKGIETIGEFFGSRFARSFVAERGRVDLVLGNNVLAHVPDINDFVAAFREVLEPTGTVTMEFPHLLELVRHGQFDTIYHEHFSYLSLRTVQRIFAAEQLVIWDVETLPTHGGSLRIWAQHQANPRPIEPRVLDMLREEEAAGMHRASFYRGLQRRAETTRDDLLAFLGAAKRAGRRVGGYGAAAKGNTLFNFAGIDTELVPFVVDASPHKQGRLLPGSHIPVVDEAFLRRERPDYVLVIPWNLQAEIAEQLAYIRDWGGQLVTAVPDLRIDGGKVAASALSLRGRLVPVPARLQPIAESRVAARPR